jgi:2-dehydro-3-deoxy-D-arabinonate dehydratase
MHLGQVRWHGAVVAALFEDGVARPIPEHNMLDLIRRAEAQGEPLAKLAAQLAARHGESLAPLLPVNPPEVWGCGCTYQTSADFRDSEHGTVDGMYAHVYREPRPEIFFKGTARVCVPTGKPIGIRADSQFTAPEPELALVLGSRGRIAGFTLANDVSAWDIERENALYLPQSKSYDGCCSLGPTMVTPDELTDPYNLDITCTIEREGAVLFSGTINTSKLHRKFENILEYLLRANHVPAGTVVLTGTGIIVKADAALAPGDIISVKVPEIGELRNEAAVVS